MCCCIIIFTSVTLSFNSHKLCSTELIAWLNNSTFVNHKDLLLWTIQNTVFRICSLPMEKNMALHIRPGQENLKTGMKFKIIHYDDYKFGRKQNISEIPIKHDNSNLFITLRNKKEYLFACRLQSRILKWILHCILYLSFTVVSQLLPCQLILSNYLSSAILNITFVITEMTTLDRKSVV